MWLTFPQTQSQASTFDLNAPEVHLAGSQWPFWSRSRASLPCPELFSGLLPLRHARRPDPGVACLSVLALALLSPCLTLRRRGLSLLHSAPSSPRPAPPHTHTCRQFPGGSAPDAHQGALGVWEHESSQPFRMRLTGRGQGPGCRASCSGRTGPTLRN